MAEFTENYGFIKLTGESLATNDFQFTDADRDLDDRLLFRALNHHHAGPESAQSDPASPPSLALATTGGSIGPGRTVYYRFTWVDGGGSETAASPEASVDTPDPIDSPAAPVLSQAASGGTLVGGTYYYVLTAYQGTNIQETRALNRANITVPVTTATNTVTITFPTAPAGATGFNVYRRSPSSGQYLYVTSVVAATTSLDDTGLADDCNRFLPITNSTNSTNKVTVTLTGATPVIPAGFTWKLYRTFTTGDYSGSLLHWETGGEMFFVDTGLGTTSGQPPEVSQLVYSPEKVDLTDSAETQGRLAMSQVSGFPWVETFVFRGDLTATAVGVVPWVCPFPRFRLFNVRASLGKGSTPSASSVIADVNKGSGTNPSYTTVFTTQANRPKVLVGQQVGAAAVPDVVEFVAGDSITVDLDQVGGGATPNDHDLVVTVYGIGFGYTSPTSEVW